MSGAWWMQRPKAETRNRKPGHERGGKSEAKRKRKEREVRGHVINRRLSWIRPTTLNKIANEGWEIELWRRNLLCVRMWKEVIEDAGTKVHPEFVTKRGRRDQRQGPEGVTWRKRVYFLKGVAFNFSAAGVGRSFGENRNPVTSNFPSLSIWPAGKDDAWHAFYSAKQIHQADIGVISSRQSMLGVAWKDLPRPPPPSSLTPLLISYSLPRGLQRLLLLALWMKRDGTHVRSERGTGAVLTRKVFATYAPVDGVIRRGRGGIRKKMALYLGSNQEHGEQKWQNPKDKCIENWRTD